MAKILQIGQDSTQLLLIYGPQCG